MMQQCDKYINGVPSQSWLATIITLEIDDFVMIGFTCDYYTTTIPTICVENKVTERELINVLRKNQIGVLWSQCIGQYIYVAFSRNSFEN
jgi:hypothetical protein